MGLKRLAGIGILAAAAVIPATQWTSGAGSDPTCPQIVHAALAATEQYCEGTGRNKVCYGNVRVEAEPRPELENFTFRQRGDTVDVADIESVRTSPMNASTGEWGVALMRLQAVGGRGSSANLTVVLMGDAELEQPKPLALATTSKTSRADANAQGPMYAFSFRSGQNDAQCAEVPESGMLIQTPEGVAEVTLLINEVDVQLGSTVYFQAVPDRALEVYVLEGHANLTAQGKTESVPAGATASVPLANNHPAGPPTDAKPYEPEKVSNAPLPLLERPIEVAPPTDDGDEEVNGPSETPTATPDDSVGEVPTLDPPTATPELLDSPTPYEAPIAPPLATPTFETPTEPPVETEDAEPTEQGTIDELVKGPDLEEARGPRNIEGPTPTPGPPPGRGRPQATLPPIYWVDWITAPTVVPTTVPSPVPTPIPECDLACPTPST